MLIYHIIAICFALLLDWFIGDPRWFPHPVVGFGKILSYCDKKWNNGSYRKVKGIMVVGTVSIILLSTTWYIVKMSYELHPFIGILTESSIIFTAIAAKSLKEAALDVYAPLQNGNLVEARKKLSWIVGRDTEKLEESEIVRGVVETVGENTSDGITAPLFYAFLGGAPFCILYRFVNTCDSMYGYKSEKYIEFGWAAARFDDLLNYIPSRITGIVMIISNFSASKQSLPACLHILKRDAPKHPSPNSGWCEAAMAGILGVQLGGTNFYKNVVSKRPKLGNKLVSLEAGHILAAVAIMIRTVIGFTILFCIGGLIVAFTIARS
jgi:adenosylcobinamide-phosphate synthase